MAIMQKCKNAKMQKCLRRLHRVWRQEDGSLTLEFLFFAPIMFWTFLATLAYFDAYKTEAVTQKAALTIADMMSREPNYINTSYVDGAYGLLQFLTPHDPDPEMRMSVLRFHAKDSSTKDEDYDHFHLVWSEVRHGPRAIAFGIMLLTAY